MIKTLKRIGSYFLPASRKYLEDRVQEIKKDVMNSQKENTKYILNNLNKNNKEMLKNMDSIKKYIDQELRRRDDWKVRNEEIQRLAQGRQVWVIKCPAPEGEMKIRWGDYHFALSLKKYLERLNCYVVIDLREDWGCEMDADVVLVLRGCLFYHPDRRNKDCVYIMWNISHPDMISNAEYELYDIVCVGSRYYADKLKKDISVPVYPLLQCTDTEEFYPVKEQSVEKKWDYIFIGNSRGIARDCVMWAVEEKIPLRMWGSGWNTILKEHRDLFEAPTIENSKIPEVYRASRATMNDHWKDMLENQFINNRIFDAMACGLPVISDTFEELEAVFPDSILYYRNKKEFHDCLNEIENNYDVIKEKVADQWPLIAEKYSFKARAQELMDIVENYKRK